MDKPSTDKHSEMIAGASGVFEAEGFRGVGVDRVIAPSGASTRTLYKHFGSRDGLVIAVLEARHRAFMDRLAAQTEEAAAVDSLFNTLRDWLLEHGARGCMLLRARSEYAGCSEDIVSLVRQQKDEFRAEVARRVHCAVGREDARLSNQIWILFEGATASASVASVAVIDDARAAAALLLASAGSHP